MARAMRRVASSFLNFDDRLERQAVSVLAATCEYDGMRQRCRIFGIVPAKSWRRGLSAIAKRAPAEATFRRRVGTHTPRRRTMSELWPQPWQIKIGVYGPRSAPPDNACASPEACRARQLRSPNSLRGRKGRPAMHRTANQCEGCQSPGRQPGIDDRRAKRYRRRTT